MSARLQSILQDFKEKGITAADMTAAELIALVHAVERVDNPYSDINADLCEQPVKVCKGCYLWPLTAGAFIWLEEYAQKWWPRGSMMYRWAQTYALAHAREREAFCRLTNKHDARKAIIATMLRFTCHKKELAVAKNRCYGLHPYDVEKAKPSTRPNEMAEGFARYVAVLEVESGIQAKHWLWGRSLMDMMTAYQRMTEIRKALGGADNGKMSIELNEALVNLANVKEMILARIELARAKHE